MRRKFLRAKWRTYSKLGKGRKKLQKYRKAKGIDNKMRLKMKSNPRNISIGFRNEKNKRGLVNGLKPVLVYNLKDIKNLKEKEIGIIAKIGDKKRLIIAEYVKEKNIKLLNINPDEYLNKIKEKREKTKERKEEKKRERNLKDKKMKKEKVEKKTEKKAEEIEKKDDEKNIEEKGKSKEEEKEPKTEMKKEKPKEKLVENKQLNKNTKNKQEIKSNNYGRGN